jgi:hypothetical protein
MVDGDGENPAVNPEIDPIPEPEPGFGGADDDDGTEDDGEEVIQAVLDVEAQHRLWLRAIIPLLQLRSDKSDPSDRVQFALDMMMIAAADRVTRLLRSDLPAN